MPPAPEFDRPIIRSYLRDVTEALASADLQREVIVDLPIAGRKLPVWALHPPLKKELPTVLLSAGIHGDEPAGVLALVAFLQKHYQKWVKNCNVVVLPCLNPSAYERGQRHSALSDQDLNRSFYPGSKASEVAAVTTYLSQLGLRFSLAIDLHETKPDFQAEGWTHADNPRSFYLYEHCAHHTKRFGRRLVEAVHGRMPICDWPTIYGDINNAGVIAYPEAMQNPVYSAGRTFDAFLLASHYTKHSLVIETPTGYDLDLRVSVMLEVLDASFKHLASLP